MTKDEWESLCDGCGKCCDIGGGVACPSLGNDRRCTVYPKRTETERCVKITPQNVGWLHKTGVLPDTCGYVRGYRADPVPEYPLIPFNVSSSKTQSDYFKSRERMFKIRGIANGI